MHLAMALWKYVEHKEVKTLLGCVSSDAENLWNTVVKMFCFFFFFPCMLSAVDILGIFVTTIQRKKSWIGGLGWGDNPCFVCLFLLVTLGMFNIAYLFLAFR